MSDARFATFVPIRNMNRAIKFYTESLGGKLTARGKGAMRNSYASLTVGDAEFWLIVPEKREKRELAYTTFIIKNIKQTAKGLKKNGVRFLRAEKESAKTRVDGPIAYNPWGASAFFKDSEGNLLMLWQEP